MQLNKLRSLAAFTTALTVALGAAEGRPSSAQSIADITSTSAPATNQTLQNIIPTPSPSTAPTSIPGVETATIKLQRSPLDVSVNGMPVGIVLVWIGNDGVLIKPEDLARAGVITEQLRTQLFHGVQYVAIADIGSGASFKLDSDALTLAITLPSTYFAASRFDLTNRETFDVQKPTNSGFINYAVGDDSSAAFRFEGEAGVNVAGGLLDTLIRRDTTTGRLVGDNTSFTDDHPNSGRHDQIGVVPVIADDFAGTGGSLRFVGASVSRDGPLNQALRQSAGNALSGIALAASTVDVYVNGVLVQRQDIPPGAFQLSNLPLQSGQNDTTVVVRDVFGRTQTYGSSLYRSANILQRGDRTYQFAVGKEINDYGLDSPSRPTDAVARYEYGFSDHLTAGGRIVVGTDLTNVGLNATFSQRFGEFALSVAKSSAAPLNSTNTVALIDSSFVAATPAPIMVNVAPGTHRVTGDALGVAYSYIDRRFAVSTSYVYQSPLYATLAHAALSDRAVSDLKSSFSYVLGRGRTLGLTYENVAYRDAGIEHELSAHYNTHIGPDADLYAGLGSRQYQGKTGADVTLRLNFAVGRHISALVSTETRDGQTERVINIAHAPTGRYGVGFGAQQTTFAGETSRTLDATDSTKVGDAQLFVGSGSGTVQSQILFSGGIAFADKSTFFTEPLINSFAVADVGIPNIGVAVNGAPANTTDRNGRVLLTDIFSYSKNAVTIDSSTLPEDVAVDQTTRELAPAYRGGNVVRFNMRHVRTFVGRLRVSNGSAKIIPAFGRMSVMLANGKTMDSDLGTAGNFYFDTLLPGSYQVSASFRGGTCIFPLVIPAATRVQTNLGELTCHLIKS